MIRNIPHLALIPLVILWFGIGEEAKLFLVVLGRLLPHLHQHLPRRALASTPSSWRWRRSTGSGPGQLFRQVVLPGALPSILVGVRYSLGFMWLTLIVAETIAATTGIGYITMNAREFMQTDVVVMGILIYALLGKLADSMAKGLERGLLQTAERRTRGSPHVSVRAVGKRFGEKRVLDDLDLEVREGEFVALVGKSGCGKSTLLRLVVGLDRPSEGEILIRRRPLEGLNREARVMFQEARILPWKTVARNVALGLQGAVARAGRDRARPGRPGGSGQGLAGHPLRRPAAARGPGPGPRQLAGPAPPRRAAGIARRPHPHRDAGPHPGLLARTEDSPPCSSPTRWRRPWSWPIGCWCWRTDASPWN